MTQSWIVNCKVSPKASTVFVWPSPSSPYNLWMPAQRARCLPALRVCKQRYRWTEGNRGHTSRLKQLSWRRRSSCGGAGTRGGGYVLAIGRRVSAGTSGDPHHSTSSGPSIPSPADWLRSTSPMSENWSTVLILPRLSGCTSKVASVEVLKKSASGGFVLALQ